MFRIGEFSKLTQISIRMLRYYDEVGLLKPTQIDKFTGYRLYCAQQIPTLNKIIFLRDTGFNVSEIAIALSQWENGLITNLLKNKQNEVKDNIQSEQEKLAKIVHAIKDIEKEKMSINYNVTIKNIPSYQVVSIRKTIPNYFSEGLLWKELSCFIEDNGVKIPKNELNIAFYHDQEYKEKNVDVEVCTTVSKIGVNKNGFVYKETDAVKMMACTMVYGSFENIASAYFSFAHWLAQHNQYKMADKPNRQICHRGPWNEAIIDNYLTEIQIVVENKNTY